MFNGIFDSSTSSIISMSDFLLCIGASLIVGIILAVSYSYKTRFTKSFVMTLGMLPTIVCVVIMMVNGNIGTGVAVAGTFSLVRFRSIPGNAKDIGMIFLAMGSGLMMGMGYIGYGMLFTIIMCLVNIIYVSFDFGISKNIKKYKSVRIVISEDLDYSHIFDEVFKKYTSSYELVKVKTTNLGSMFKLTYDITLKDPLKEKEMIDELRVRNGNLEITVSRQETSAKEL